MRFLIIVALLAGCTLYESKASGGDDGSGSGSGGPVGRSFFLDRTPTSPAGCPFFSEENQPHDIAIEPTQVRIDGSNLAASPSVRNTPAREPVDAPNVTFKVFEQWNSAEGPAAPSVDYQLWVDGTFISGKASSTFTFNSIELGPTSCSYTWQVSVLSP